METPAPSHNPEKARKTRRGRVTALAGAAVLAATIGASQLFGGGSGDVEAKATPTASAEALPTTPIAEIPLPEKLEGSREALQPVAVQIADSMLGDLANLQKTHPESVSIRVNRGGKSTMGNIDESARYTLPDDMPGIIVRFDASDQSLYFRTARVSDVKVTELNFTVVDGNPFLDKPEDFNFDPKGVSAALKDSNLSLRSATITDGDKSSNLRFEYQDGTMVETMDPTDHDNIYMNSDPATEVNDLAKAMVMTQNTLNQAIAQHP